MIENQKVMTYSWVAWDWRMAEDWSLSWLVLEFMMLFSRTVTLCRIMFIFSTSIGPSDGIPVSGTLKDRSSTMRRQTSAETLQPDGTFDSDVGLVGRELEESTRESSCSSARWRIFREKGQHRHKM